MDIETIKEYTKIYIDSLSYTKGSIFCDDTYKQYQLEKLSKLNSTKTIFSYLNVINKGNRFDFLNFLYKYNVITDQECADTLYSIWTMQERFYDCGMAKTKMIKFMKMAEKSLVLPDDIDKLSDDSVITIYRGVKENDYKGLSWTIDKNTAIWFAKRFSNVDCYVFTGQLKKKDIIAYFNNRDEAEIVCDYRKIKHISCEKVQLMDSEKDKCSIPTSIEIFDTNCVKKRKCFKNG